MPLYKGALERRPAHAEPLSILFLFIALFLAGLWHGSTINWVVYGVLNGLGVAAAKMWEIILIKRRGRAGLREYMNSRTILVIAVIANMHFVCLTCLFFAEEMHRTLKAVGVFLGI
jgi:D-alanyl-lipoteichoic acid acyltransferase DltB (MBOAT superfamily)